MGESKEEERRRGEEDKKKEGKWMGKFCFVGGRSRGKECLMLRCEEGAKR